ncbi:MAG: L-threonylcarbamoyladenylate synthase [Balneolaceae bacterium]
MNIDEATEVICNGGVVAFPTETVYGLGADALNPEAIARVFKIKGRPSDNPLIIHLSDPEQVALFSDDIPQHAFTLMSAFWPGPLTLVFQKRDNVPDIATGGLPSVALRIPDHPTALELIRRTGPLVGPSANPSGKPSPTRARHVRNDFGDRVSVLDGGECRIGLESTVLDMTSDPPRILRPGEISPEAIQKIIGIKPAYTQSGGHSSPSPGVRYTHYKPDASVAWYSSGTQTEWDKTLLITHQALQGSSSKIFARVVHYRGNYDLLARELYDQFRTADKHGLKRILIEPFSSEIRHPIIAALINRIEKAVERDSSHD